MLRLNVLSGTTVLTVLVRRALRAAQLSQKIHSQPRTNTKTRNATPRQLQSDWISLETASPHPLKSPMLRRKAVTTAASSGPRPRVKHRNNQQQNTKR